MKVLIDTCIILDALEERGEFKKDADAILISHTNGLFKGFITAKSIMDVYYLISRFYHNEKEARRISSNLLNVLSGLDSLMIDCKNALHGNMKDCEDELMVQTALREGMDGIVTRNLKDYKNAGIQIYSPKSFLNTIGVVGWN